MKKLLASALAAATLLTGAASVFAEDPVPLADGLVLAEGSHLKIADGSIDMIDGDITVAELKANFSGNVSVTSPDGTAKADDAAVATDDIVKAGEDSAKAIIWGDSDRNGKINLTDIIGMMKHAAMWNDVGISETAADVDRTGKVNLNDVAKMLKYLAGWDDISLGNVRMVFENTAVEAENEDDTLKLSFTNMMNKIGAHLTHHTGENSFKIKLAKNEYESCTALLWSDTAKEGMTAELSDFVYEYGDAVLKSELEWVIFQPKQTIFTRMFPWDLGTALDEAYTDDHPEALVNMTDTFELQAEANQQFVITVQSEKDTPAGMYKATLTFKDADGKAVKTANIYAYVWDFELPDTPYSASLFGTRSFNDGGVNRYPEYYEYMLEQNLSSYKLPYHILSDEAEAVMSDPRVTAFNIDGNNASYTGDITDEETVAAYAKIKANPDWFKKGLFYYTDEPYASGLLDVKTTYEYVTNLLGTTDIRNITPLGDNSWPSDEHQSQGIDAITYIDPYINVWCPRTDAYHRMAERGAWTSRHVYSLYGEYPERAAAFREKGEEIWWYICIAPSVPYANFFTSFQGVIVRDVLWQQYFNDVDGLLYYATGEYWGGISKYNFDISNGDGTLLYAGEFWGRTGPSASWRLYQIRDGFDDFDYLTIAEELVGREEVMKVVNKVTQGMFMYTEDYRVLDAARDEIVKIILAEQAEK